MTKRNRALAWVSAGALALLLAAPAAMAEEEEEAANSRLSGYMVYDFNTNFMSYGADIWGKGTFKQVLFQPTFGLELDLGKGFTAFTGTWFDWNSNSNDVDTGPYIGEDDYAVQEIDVWLGFGYSYEKFSVSIAYQEWLYANDSERILDITLAYDTILSPSITIHNRVDKGQTNDEGTVFVLGLEHALDVGPVGLAFPVSVGFVTRDFYQDGEGGFGYFSAGANASYGLAFIPAAFGSWDLHAGGTYYHTDDDNINNRDDDLFTANFGIGVAW